MKFNLLLILCFFAFSGHLMAQEDNEMKVIEMELESMLKDTVPAEKACCSKPMEGKCGKCSSCPKCTSGACKMSTCGGCKEKATQGCCSAKMDAANSCCSSAAMSCCCGPKYKNFLGVSGRYYFTPLDNTRSLLANNGFPLDEYAVEIQVRLYNLPKLYYYEQLGSLSSNKFASVKGIGVKQDLRWNIVKSSAFFFTPYIEVGGGYYRMNITKGVSGNSVTSILTSSVETNYADNFVLTGDLGLDVGVGFKLDNTRLSFLVNGGYLTNVPTEWRLAGSLVFKEKINLASPYLGATIRLELEK
ncbi:MAG: hypothetical protein LC107_11110 [Chitinophagales bacterium]|nr:hypothetical protein [Chitinophagales bacterium]